MEKRSVLLSVFLAVVSTSSSLNAIPHVWCEMTLSEKLYGGDEIAKLKANLEPSSISLGPFTLKAQIKEKRTAGSLVSPCLGYELIVTISKGITEETMSTIIGEPSRYSTKLIVGNDKAFVNCDVQKE